MKGAEQPMQANPTPANPATPASASECHVTNSERCNEALHTIKNHTMAAMGVGILPAPGLDLLALTGIQLDLLRKLSALYGSSFSQETGKKILSALLGSYLPLAVAAPVASVLKFIPGVGIAAGALAQSVTAGATTYAVGKLFVEHFESGGTFLDFEPSKWKSKLRHQVQEGKDFIKKHAGGGGAENA